MSRTREALAWLAAAAIAAAGIGACVAFDGGEAVVRDASRGLESACAYYREAPGVKRTPEADRICAVRAAVCDEGAGGEHP